MELRDYIECGIKKTGSLTALGLRLGISQPHMSAMKVGRLAMPAEKCVLLADLVEADRFQVIAAAKFASAKDDEKKSFWRPFVDIARAAMLTGILVAATSFFAPSSAEAAPILTSAHYMICIM